MDPSATDGSPEAQAGYEDRGEWPLLPSEERSLFQGAPAADSQPWILARISQYERRILSLRSEYNRASSIHRHLPPEVLMEMFSCVNPTSLRDVQIAQVCRLWRRLIMRVSAFWASLCILPVVTSVSDAREQIRFETLLTRSAPRTLAFSSFTASSAACATFKPHLHRITSLVMRCPSKAIKPLCDMLMQSMPNLAVLEIRHDDGTLPEEDALTGIRSFVSQPHRLPRLRRLALPGIMLEMDFSTAPITSFQINECGCASCIEEETLDNLLSLLQRHRYLTDVDWRPRFCPPADPPVASSPSIRLPHLRRFLLGANTPSWITNVIDRLNVPLDTYFELFVIPESPHEMIPTTVQGLPAVSAAQCVTMIFHPLRREKYARLLLQRDSPAQKKALSFSLTLCNPSHSEPIYGEFMSALLALYPGGPSPATSLSVEIATGELYSAIRFKDKIGDLLRVFDNIVSLNAAMKDASPDHLMVALRTTPDGRDAPPCPHLKDLDVTWWWAPETSVGEVEATFGQIERTLEYRSGHAARLQRFTFTCDWYPHLQMERTPEELRKKMVNRWKRFASRVSGWVHMHAYAAAQAQ